MEGLEITEILKSELERTQRLDSEFYSKSNLEILKRIEKKNPKPLTDFVKVSDGNHMSISDYFTEVGIPYYRGGDIYNFFIEQTSQPLKISETVFKWPHMRRSHLHKGDVLISIVGAIIGNLSLVRTNQKATCSCKLAILRPKSIKSELVAVYLKSYFGQNQIQKYRRGSGQTGLILEDFDQLLIPSFSVLFSNKIEEIVTNAFSKSNESEKTYTQAEALLLETIGLRDFKPSKDPVNIKQFNDSFVATGRLDAEYYQKKYEDYERIIKNCSSGSTTIDQEYTLVNDSSQKDKLSYNYIEISDVNVGDGTSVCNLIETPNLPANAKKEVKRGDLLISKVRPYRGAVTIIDFDAENLIVSGAFTVLRERTDSVFSNETLKVILRTSIYRDWLLKFNIGTQYPVIRDEDVLNLPIPKISKDVQEEISKEIRLSQKLEKQSEQLLELAKRAVEIAIEQGEETAIDYIKANT
ncbi:restriction endonuclease subunit S [bacterium]|nr:restriction endonuclease subunit S [bacterium]